MTALAGSVSNITSIPADESINQQTNQSINRSIDQSINQSTINQEHNMISQVLNKYIKVKILFDERE
jgi:shikimate kinase